MQPHPTSPPITLRTYTGQDLRRLLRVPRLPADLPYLLVRRPDHPLTKPAAFATLRDLAAAIHRDRQGAPLQLVEASLRGRDEAEARDGVSIFTLTPDGDRRRYLGWAWLGGGGRRALEVALFSLDPCLARAA